MSYPSDLQRHALRRGNTFEDDPISKKFPDSSLLPQEGTSSQHNGQSPQEPWSRLTAKVAASDHSPAGYIAHDAATGRGPGIALARTTTEGCCSSNGCGVLSVQGREHREYRSL